MRIPEVLFPFINFGMKLLLNSRLHGLMSGSLMTIYFTGRRTGRALSLPVRYMREDDGRVTCMTSREVPWWRNFLAPVSVELQLGGGRVAATAQSFPDDMDRKAGALRRRLECFPGDAPYHGLPSRRRASDSEFDAAVRDAVVVHFTLTD